VVSHVIMAHLYSICIYGHSLLEMIDLFMCHAVTAIR